MFLLKNKYSFRYGQSGLDSFRVQLYFPHTVGTGIQQKYFLRIKVPVYSNGKALTTMILE
jgi:hypothetical protein